MFNCQSIIKVFEKQGLKSEGLYREDEINLALDQLSQREFDRELAIQLYQQCKPTYVNLTKMIRIADFVQTIVDAKIILQDKVDKARHQLEVYSGYKTNYETILPQSALQLDNTYLFVTLKTVNNLSSKVKFSSCYINLILGAASQKAWPIKQSDKYHPEFNQEFEFTLSPLLHYLLAQFYLKVNDNSPPTLFGQTQIYVSTQDDSILKEIVAPLKDPVGREIGTSLTLNIQIVTNKVLLQLQKPQYLEQQIKIFTEKIEIAQQELKLYEQNLTAIQRPFQNQIQRQESLQTRQPTLNMWQPQQNKPEEMQNKPEDQMEQSIIANSQQIPISVHQSKKIIELVDDTPNAPYNLEHGITIFNIYQILTLFVCFAKPSFLDFIVSTGLLFTVFADRFDPYHIKLVGGGLLSSLIYDILWLKQYHIWWNSNNQNNPEWGENAATLLRFVILFTYIQFIYKFIVCYYLYQFYKEAEDPTKRFLFKVWGITYKVGQNRENIFWK